MIFITALVLIFILRLRFPKGKSVAAMGGNVTLWRPIFGTDKSYSRLAPSELRLILDLLL